MDALQATYKRGQVEQAIARVQRVATDEPQAPQNLRSDLKRLLDIDRTPRAEKLKINQEPNAFFDDAGGPKKGNEVNYRAFHAFALVIAYRLVETGMTQSRVVGFMREIRSALEAKFAELIQAGPSSVQPELKKLTEAEADRLILQGNLVSDPEAMTFLIARAGSQPARFLRMHPVYHDLVVGNVCSFAELKDYLIVFDQHRQGIVVLGLTNAAYQIVAMLARVEAPKRGRPASKMKEKV